MDIPTRGKYRLPDRYLDALDLGRLIDKAGASAVSERYFWFRSFVVTAGRINKSSTASKQVFLYFAEAY